MHASIASRWGVWVPDTVDARRLQYYYQLVRKEVREEEEELAKRKT